MILDSEEVVPNSQEDFTVGFIKKILHSESITIFIEYMRY